MVFFSLFSFCIVCLESVFFFLVFLFFGSFFCIYFNFFFWFVVRRTSRGQIQFVLDAFIKSTQWVAVSSPVFFSRKKDTDFFCCCCFSFFVQKYWVYGSFNVVGTLMWQQDNNNDTNDDIELSFSFCYE